MTLDQLCSLIAANPQGVILLEGKRDIPPEHALKAKALATQLARDFLTLRFRSGNAEGADEAFSAGVAAVDPSRLQILAPYKGHRRKDSYEGATYDTPESLSAVQEEAVAYQTMSATPSNKGLVERRKTGGRAAAKAAYLIRDTMKVVGHTEDFPKPILGIFYVNPADPESGGTGHTIRVCRQHGVPVVFQDAWEMWIHG